MNIPTFIDTSYILALVNTADEYHSLARAASQGVQSPFITTEAVLIEIGNALSRQRWRTLGLATINDLHTDPDIEVLPVDTDLFERALRLYGQRLDKEWGLTDCISFVVMQERGVTQVLTTDHHFAQAGFYNLLSSLRR
jgi:uncharacterized protein